MPTRLLPNQEKKLPISICVEDSLAFKFKVACANMDSNVSKEIRKMIIVFLKKHEKQTKT